MIKKAPKDSRLTRSLIWLQNNILTKSTFVPAQINSSEPQLTNSERQKSIDLMRINHIGEICAQGLYLGQKFSALDPSLKEQLTQAAKEEKEHLIWCQQRVIALGGQTSQLEVPYFILSYLMGALSGLFGDKTSLGFLAETEYQVSEHLDHHLQTISANDLPSIAILTQMRIDEKEHERQARIAGGEPLPIPIRFLMQCLAKVMIYTTPRI
jgi:ubiquinone biosynthesis monooxygenase Coq7